MIACLPKHTLAKDLRALSLKAIPVTLVGPPDRKPAAEFGESNGNLSEAQIKQQYAGSGDLACKNSLSPGLSTGQAQLVLKNDMIVTSGHVLRESDDPCVDIDPEKCRFIVEVDGKPKAYPVQAVIGSAFRCPKIGDKNDWIGLKLKLPVDKKIKPYPLDKNVDAIVGEFQDVVNVAKSRDWPPDQHQPGILTRPRHYGNCKTGVVEKSGSSGEVEMDCDVDHGASGGGVFSPGPNPVLLAINQSVNRKLPQGCDPTIGSSGQDSYHPHCWTNYATPITGEFKEMLLQAAGINPKMPAPPEESTINRAPEGFKLPSMRIK